MYFCSLYLADAQKESVEWMGQGTTEPEETVCAKQLGRETAEDASKIPSFLILLEPTVYVGMGVGCCSVRGKEGGWGRENWSMKEMTFGGKWPLGHAGPCILLLEVWTWICGQWHRRFVGR